MDNSSHAGAVGRLAPYVAGVCVAIASLRGVGDSDVYSTDAARHALNGVFLHDIVRSGEITDPIGYAKKYYAHLPAISLPYHPPLFPAVEAGMFFLFGVSLGVARAVVAFAAALCAILLYRRLHAAFASHLLCVAVLATFFLLKPSIRLSTDVMLELPALALTLCALAFFRETDGKWRLRDGILFALFGGAAVWTKQHAVFVGLVPFMYVVVARRWSLLKGLTLWISAGILGLIVLALIAVSFSQSGVGVRGQFASSASVASVIVRNFSYYGASFFQTLGIFPGVACLTAVFVFLVRKRKAWSARPEVDLLLSWVISDFLFVMCLRQNSHRYMFYIYPPMISLGYVGVLEICRKISAFSLERWVLPVCVLITISPSAATPPSSLHGPDMAAKFVLQHQAKRILYCGYWDGAFTFSVRKRGAPLKEWVIRGDKLEADTFRSDRIAEFAHRYGIDYLILERTDMQHPWDRLVEDLPESFELAQKVPLRVQPASAHNGTLYIYRFSAPSSEPEDPSQLQLSRIGTDLGRFTRVQSIIETPED